MKGFPRRSRTEAPASETGAVPAPGGRLLNGLVLIRHGATAINARGGFQGWIDPDLSREGVRQARAAGRLLREAGPTPAAVWSSDLLRARRTAEIAFPGMAVREDPRLRELCFGSWEGRTWHDIDASDRAALRAWTEDPERVAPPGGETLAHLRARVEAWCACLGERSTGEPGAVVTHGGPLRLLLARFLALPAVWSVESRLRVPPGAVIRMGPRP